MYMLESINECVHLCVHMQKLEFSFGDFFPLSPFYLFICLLVYVLRQSCSLNLERPILVRATGQGVLEFLGLHPVSAGVTGTHYPGHWGFKLNFMCAEQTHIEPSSQFPDLGPIFLFLIF